MNYAPGRSEGRGDKGYYYTANVINGKEPGHDDVFRQNPTLEEIVGTRDEPTSHIFDCTQGTVGQDGESGEATGLRQAKYGLNLAQRHLNGIYDVREQKLAVSVWCYSSNRGGGGGLKQAGEGVHGGPFCRAHTLNWGPAHHPSAVPQPCVHPVVTGASGHAQPMPRQRR